MYVCVLGRQSVLMYGVDLNWLATLITAYTIQTLGAWFTDVVIRFILWCVLGPSQDGT